jgi:hypothetical protein
MKNKRYSYSADHERFLKNGISDRLYYGGLCYTYGDSDSSGGYGNNDPLFKLFIEDNYPFWGHENPDADSRTKETEYTELRQNIVLLMAAMNGEL